MRQLLEDFRLVTLAGIGGGGGKTRLAIQIANELHQAQVFRDGIWWVDLASLTSERAALLPQTVAKAIGAVEQPGQPLVETLGEFLHARQLLLVLDNCEQMVPSCLQLIEPLNGLPGLESTGNQP